MGVERRPASGRGYGRQRTSEGIACAGEDHGHALVAVYGRVAASVAEWESVLRCFFLLFNMALVQPGVFVFVLFIAGILNLHVRIEAWDPLDAISPAHQ